MARARNIKPGFFKNEDLAECSPWTRLCFIGLWMLADREGRLEDRPKRIKGELFPYDSFELEPLLQELAQYGFIERYEVDGIRVIAIPKFSDHQTPHIKEKASELPGKNGACTGSKHDADIKNDAETPDYTEAILGKSDASTRLAPDKPDAGTMQALDKPRKGSCQHPLNPSSLNPDSLNPDSLIADSLIGASGHRPDASRTLAHASHAEIQPVDNPGKTEGLAITSVAKPEKVAPLAEPDKPKKSDKPSSKRAERAAQGSRLPDGWQLPQDWGDWALQERPDLSVGDVQREAACFADYWRAKAGTDARKTDWEATWRNWIRRVNQQNRRTLTRASPSVHVPIHPHASDSWIRPASLQAKEIAEQKLFGVVIDATT